MSDIRKESKEIIKGILMAIILYFIIQISLVVATGVDDPVSVVISGSMDHRGYDFDQWWELKYDEYLEYGISKEDFLSYGYSDGFEKGDILFITDVDTADIEVGDVIVFSRGDDTIPIVHRVVSINTYGGEKYFVTKGDYNPIADNFQTNGISGVHESYVIGKVSGILPEVGKITLFFRGVL
ncbi:MAG TPA: signal peptidase I [Candidatus Methanofastidiosa archaeon]|nr:signal peptidase I [Candidatus Methanofastidiosa archaeon]